MLAIDLLTPAANSPMGCRTCMNTQISPLSTSEAVRWRREWVVLGREHLAFLDRKASEIGIPASAIIRLVLDKAIVADRARETEPLAEATVDV